jgi:ABC-type siderophore export system fused ATPase/permease subunit
MANRLMLAMLGVKMNLVSAEVAAMTIINILQTQSPEHNFTLFGHNCGLLIMLTMLHVYSDQELLNNSLIVQRAVHKSYSRREKRCLDFGLKNIKQPTNKKMFPSLTGQIGFP